MMPMRRLPRKLLVMMARGDEDGNDNDNDDDGDDDDDGVITMLCMIGTKASTIITTMKEDDVVARTTAAPKQQLIQSCSFIFSNRSFACVSILERLFMELERELHCHADDVFGINGRAPSTSHPDRKRSLISEFFHHNISVTDDNSRLGLGWKLTRGRKNECGCGGEQTPNFISVPFSNTLCTIYRT